jgi:hypothetical protein
MRESTGGGTPIERTVATDAPDISNAGAFHCENISVLDNAW